ncbi:T9SS type A sorting domain-containing protein [uncultured Psychroserpens sp.]|uniref:T9SS type A sorting domain-containing protein n=1 Tax=uncultured Psychroserpens sp. TaxID=255436 RepID=UPI0026138743|nr:T9SS type A sorting domain-containing protein [uncultured Psychroserpens sp.]
MKQKLLILSILFSVNIYAQEFGTNDFRISDMGDNGATNFFAFFPEVAYSDIENKYLVVWSADDNTGTVVDNEFEIYGQFISDNGIETGVNDFRISVTGTDGETQLRAEDPHVVYNSTDNEFLVVWRGETSVDNEFEIFGQIVDANTGNLVGANFRISDMGNEGDTSFGAFLPRVSYSATSNEYLVIWEGDESINNKFEIYGQRLSNSGAEIGVNDFQISQQLPLADANFDARGPDLIWNSIENDFLIVWQGETSTDDEKEIYGQIYDLDSQSISGSNFRISDMGPDTNISFFSIRPRVAYNATDNEYLVVWNGTDTVISQFEVYGQLLSSSGSELGSNDFQITAVTATDSNFDTAFPDVVWNNTNNEYMVIYRADFTLSEEEVFGQKLNASGTNNSTSFRLSDMGDDNDSSFKADSPAIATNNQNAYIITWYGDDNIPPLVGNENEIFIQMYGDSTLSLDDAQITNNIKIYPNPNTTSVLTISGLQNIDGVSLDIYDILGKRVFNNVTIENNTLNLSNLKSGLYLMKFTGTNLNKIIKLVVN